MDSVEKNNLSEVQRWIEQSSNINQIDEYGYSALHIACARGYLGIAKYLIQEGINVNLQDKNGQTALHYVAIFGLMELVNPILNANGRLDIEDKYGNEPLWCAVFYDKGRNERMEMIEKFLEFSADPNHKNSVDRSPKDFASLAGYPNIMALLKTA